MVLTIADYVVFVLYFVAIVIFAMAVAYRQKGKSAEEFFMAGHRLPWYVVGSSIIAAGVSAEHFIGTVGWAYLYGMAVANWQWAAVVVYSILIWIFLPYYMRGHVSTMPEFLERRYNRTCRYIYAFITIVGMVIALLGGVTFAGAKALNVLFPELSIPAAVVLLGLAAGIYTIYGGLISGAWADVLQYTVLMVGGIAVSAVGLTYVGGIGNLLDALPEKAIMVYPPTHEAIPWTGLIAAFLTVGVWYNCANQFIVQRFLGARSEWDARMGVVMAGFTGAILPFVIVIPGLVAFYMFQDELSDGDQSWPFLVARLLPPGLTGFVLAGLAAAIMSTLSAIVHSSATVFTLDLYKPVFRPQASDKEVRLVGRITGALCVLIGIAVAIFLAAMPGLTVFEIIQTVFFYVAAPITAIFFVGILWSGATPSAAVWTMVIGFASIPFVRYYIFKLPGMVPYDSFTHHTFVVYLFSVVLVIVLSLFTKPKPKEELRDVIWDASALRVPEKERPLNRGLRNFALWWGLMVVTILGLYIATNARAGGTLWLEAESVAHTTSAGGEARLQARQELESFNLWTGATQVLFEPSGSGDWIRWELPVEADGRYEVAAVVTEGPDYGQFGAAVDGQDAEIGYVRTTVGDRGRFRVEEITAPVFDARIRNNGLFGANGGKDQSQRHVVRRITLGSYALKKGTVPLTFTAVDVQGDGAKIGVDQLMLTRVD